MFGEQRDKILVRDDNLQVWVFADDCVGKSVNVVGDVQNESVGTFQSVVERAIDDGDTHVDGLHHPYAKVDVRTCKAELQSYFGFTDCCA